MPPCTGSDPGTVLRALSSLRGCLAAMDATIVRDQIAVTQIAAPTGAEGERARWMAERLAHDAGCEVQVDDAGNVIGRRAGVADLPAIAVCAHLDTVFPADTTLAIRKQGSRLVGPGINDNGRGLAAMLGIARALAELDVRTHHPIEFVATTGEEGLGDLRGAKHYFAHPDREVAAAIVVDGAGDERIVHRALGSRRFRVEFLGCGGHSWGAFGAPNAVHAAADCTTRLARLPLPRAPRVTLSVGRIGGGLSVNAIPAAAWIEVDLRSTASEPLEQLEREVRRAAEAALHDENARRVPSTPPLTLMITRIGERPCGETPAGHPLVRAAVEATRLIGRSPDLALASTDANVPISRGIPAIAIGAGGRGGEAHTPQEWYDNTDGILGVQRALAIVVTAAGLA